MIIIPIATCVLINPLDGFKNMFFCRYSSLKSNTKSKTLKGFGDYQGHTILIPCVTEGSHKKALKHLKTQRIISVFLFVLDGNLNAVNGVANRNGCHDAAAKSNDSLGWSEVTSDGSPQCEPDTSEPVMDEEEEELLNNEEEDQSQDRMSGTSSPQSPYGDMREAEWEPLSLSAKVNGSGCSPSRASEDLSGRNGHFKEEPNSELGGPMGRVSIFQAEALRYRPLPTEEDSEGETEVERPPRLDSWALGFHERGLEMTRGRVNLSLLEQAIALQTEQRQVLHHAYREMDRFLMEQMTNERRHHRMMDMDSRLNYHGGKGNNKEKKTCDIR